MTFKIITHALRMVFSNIIPTLHVTAVLYLMTQAVSIIGNLISVGQVHTGGIMAQIEAGELFPTALFWVFFIFSMLVSIIATSWMAVAWHRYVLLGEQSSFVPKYPKGLVGRYFFTALGATLLIMVPAIILLIFVGMAVGYAIANPVVTIIFSIVFLYLLWRVTMTLPVLSVGNNMSIRDSWKHTAKLSAPIFGVSVIIGTLTTLAQFLPTTIPGAWIISILLGWVSTVVGLSILTTIYGICVESREID